MCIRILIISSMRTIVDFPFHHADSAAVRGVSGGERKRVSIAEAALGGSPLQCWDNSTRGLDSATALDFVRTLKLSCELSGATAVVAIYQASQTIYDVSRSNLQSDSLFTEHRLSTR